MQAQAHQGGTFNIIAHKTILYRFDQKSAHRETHGHNFPAHKHYKTCLVLINYYISNATEMIQSSRSIKEIFLPNPANQLLEGQVMVHVAGHRIYLYRLASQMEFCAAT